MIELLSIDIEWFIEIHISSDDRSGSSAHQFIIITDNFIIFSYLSLCILITIHFQNILGSFLNKLTDLSQILGFYISTTIFTGNECFW